MTRMGGGGGRLGLGRRGGGFSHPLTMALFRPLFFGVSFVVSVWTANARLPLGECGPLAGKSFMCAIDVL